MADITMCKGENCPLHPKCHRFTARPDPISQSYLMESPYKNDKCEYFWDNSNRKYNRVVNNPEVS